MNLQDAITVVERELATWNEAVPGYSHEAFNYTEWTAARAKAQAEGEQRLLAEGAAIRSGSTDFAFRFAGVRSSSTNGFHGALQNWRRAAKAKLAKGDAQ